MHSKKYRQSPLEKDIRYDERDDAQQNPAAWNELLSAAAAPPSGKISEGIKLLIERLTARQPDGGDGEDKAADQFVQDVEEVDREIAGALNNAFPEDAPDVLAHVGGQLNRALTAYRRRAAAKRKESPTK